MSSATPYPQPVARMCGNHVELSRRIGRERRSLSLPTRIIPAMSFRGCRRMIVAIVCVRREVDGGMRGSGIRFPERDFLFLKLKMLLYAVLLRELFLCFFQ